MLSFQQIYTHVKAAADELNQMLPSAGIITPINQQTQIAHKQAMLNKLKTIFEKHQPADEKAELSELIQDLRTHLETAWKEISGTLLSYTALPLDSLTRIHVDLANTLAARINQTAQQPVSALKLLMPTLEGLTDPVEGYPNLGPYQDENDQWVIPEVDILKVLTTHIQSEKGTYLVPIQHLVRAFPVIKEEKQEAKHEEKKEEEQEEVRVDTRNDLLKRNPYGFADDATSYELSKDEITRLQNYSRLTQELANAEDNLVALTQKDTSFLGYLNRFINALHLNSVAGIGNEENAGFAAYAAIINFNDYYHLLPDTERDKIPKGLKDAIDNLLGFASDKEKNKNAVKTIQTCIAIRRGEIEKEKRPHEKLLATIGGAKVESLLTHAKEQIEHTRIALQSALDKNKLNGADPLGIKRSLLQTYGIKPTFSSLADLVLITSLNTNEIKELLQDNDIQNSFLKTITNMNDLMGISIELTADKLTAILELTKDALFKKCVGNNPGNFLAWIFGLSPEKIEPIVRFNMDAIHAFHVYSQGRLYPELVKILSQAQWEAVLKGGLLAKIMQDHTILNGFHYDTQAEIIKYITNDSSMPMEQRTTFLKNFFEPFIQNPIRSGKMLIEAIKFNPKLFGQYLNESNDSPNDVIRVFATWISNLPLRECKIMIQQNLEAIKNKIDVKSYARALNYVNEEKLQTAFESGLRQTIMDDSKKLREFFDGANNLPDVIFKKFQLFSLLANKNTPDGDIRNVFDSTFLGSCVTVKEKTFILRQLLNLSDQKIVQRGIPTENLSIYLLPLPRLHRLDILANFNENTLAFYFKDADAIKSFFDAEKKATGGNSFATYCILKRHADKAKIPFPELPRIEDLPRSFAEIYQLVDALPVNARMDVFPSILSMSTNIELVNWNQYVYFFDLFPEESRKDAAKLFQDRFFAFPLLPATVSTFMAMKPREDSSLTQRDAITNTIFELFEDRMLPAKGIEGLIQFNHEWRTLYERLTAANQYKLADYVITRFESSPHNSSFDRFKKADRNDLAFILSYGGSTPTIGARLNAWKDAIMPSKERDGILQNPSDFIWLCEQLKHKSIDAFSVYSILSDKVLPSASAPGLVWKKDDLTTFVSHVFINTDQPTEKEVFLAEFQKQFFSGKINCEPRNKTAILEELCRLRPQAATEFMEIFMSAYEQDRRGHVMLKGFGRSDYLKKLNQTECQVIKEQDQYASSQINQGYIRVGVRDNVVYKEPNFYTGGVFRGYEPINLSPAELKTFDDVLKPTFNKPRYLVRDELKKIAEITHHTEALGAHDSASVEKIIAHNVEKPKSRTAKVLDKLLNQPGGILGISQSSASSLALTSSSSSSGLFSTRSRSNAVDAPHSSASSSASMDSKRENKR